VLTIVALGAPKTQGSVKAVVSRSTGRPMIKKDNEKSQNEWRANVRDQAREVMGDRDPMEGPVVLAITFTRDKPGSAPKRKPSWPFQKPDWDKLARAISDGLKDGGAYRDDAQVVWAIVAKHYPISSDGREPLHAGGDAEFIRWLATPGSTLDVLNVPGVVVRLAHLTEFDGIRKQLADAGYEPKDVTGGA
jgi:Holliday junction resolvase RusA-like endonuclease